MEESKVVHEYGRSPEPLRIKVERGQKGGYAFEVNLFGADESIMIARIKGIYEQLDREFCPKEA